MIDVSEYGAVPNSFRDATASLQKAIGQCKPGGGPWVLYFPKGRYDLWPDSAARRNYYISNTSSKEECPSKIKTIALLFESRSDITIEGNGSLFVYHGKMITWAFDHCSRIRLRDVELDFERPSMSEMTLVRVSDTVIWAVVHPDSRFTIINDAIRWYGEGWGNGGHFSILVRPGDSTFRYSEWDIFRGAQVRRAGGDTVVCSGYFQDGRFKPGDIVTVRDPVRDQVGMFIHLSEQIELENVRIHYMHGLGIVSQFSRDLRFDHVAIEPWRGRVIAAFADCMHFSGCRGAIEISNCHFSGSHDDDINVHGTQLSVAGVAGNVVRLRFGHGQSYGFQAYYPGDTVHLVHSASLETYGSGIVSAATMTGDTGMELRLRAALPAGIQAGDCVENISWTPAVTVRDCLFGSTNTRGVLVTTPRKVVIDHNVFSRTGMQAILIADDASSWYESGPVRDVRITRNTFMRCGYNLGDKNYTIAIAPENHQLVKNVYVHQNIFIGDNTFYCIGQQLLQARSTRHLSFVNNRVIRPFPTAGVDDGIDLVACDEVEVSANISKRE